MATPPPMAGRYELGALLAEDGVKQVYAGVDRQLGRDVVVELATTDDADLRERFLARARLLAGENHPQLVTVYDTGTSDGHPYAILEPEHAVSLAQRLRDGPALTLAQVVDLGIELCQAAAAALQRELEIEPLDPADVLLRDGAHVMLTNLLLRPGSAAGGPGPGRER